MNSNQYSHMETYQKKKEIFVHGHGVWLYDKDNEKYLDFTSGIAVNVLGHTPKVIFNAIKKQGSKLLHISNLFWNQPQIDLANLLIEESDHKDVFFCNSGAEAVEASIKIARKYGKKINKNKNKIIYFENSFHGRTMGALSVTSNTLYQDVATPLIPNTVKLSLSNIDLIESSIDELTCAVIIEPIQGEGGIISISNDVLIRIQKKCNEFKALFIFDEIQCGIGRTGNFFAYKNTGVIPDLICLAKGLGGGLPIGAVISNEKSSILKPGDHGSTFGGNPLVCAVAIEVVNIVSNKNFLDKVKIKSLYLKNKLAELKSKYPVIKEIRGEGLLLGIVIDSSTKEYVDELYKNKILVVGAGQNVIRILPPLNVTIEEIDIFLDGLNVIFDLFVKR